MPLIFRPKHNYLARLSLVVGGLGALGAVSAILIYVRTPLARGMQDPVEQPIQFDHRHHTRDEGIDCRFCHQTVETSPFAGIPSTQLCMNCHSQIWNGSPMLEKVRQSFIEDKPIVWTKVNDVPDFVFFNHAIHVNKGVGCVSCHGRVDTMAAVGKAKTLTMAFCLECHRNPGPSLRPVEEVTNMEWKAPVASAHGESHGESLGESHHAALDPQAFAKKMVKDNDVHTRTSCTTCHR